MTPMLRIVPLLLFLPVAPAWARDTHLCRDGVVSTTSSSAELLKKCGQPDRIVRLENEHGAAIGERWEYFVDDRTVMFTIRAGRVQAIDRA